MLQVKLTPQEIQFTISALHNVQIMGKDAHTMSALLKKYEDKLAELKPVQRG